MREEEKRKRREEERRKRKEVEKQKKISEKEIRIKVTEIYEKKIILLLKLSRSSLVSQCLFSVQQHNDETPNQFWLEGKVM